ncbi:hypothetical protein [Nitratireductor rhodophyticola]|uniref:hypothetical protein n=1 Tax=Nitratireductor rhodophyticola TaxID=2854036 RepID=UPI003008F14A
METNMQRIERLSKELSKALDDWIENEMDGERWALRVYPSTIRSDVVYLENIEFCADVVKPRSTPAHRRLASGGAE